MNDTNKTTITMVTPDSRAFSSVTWVGWASVRGDLTVNYRKGGQYVYTDVHIEDMVTLVRTADEGRSLGSALHRVLGHRMGQRVAA